MVKATDENEKVIALEDIVGEKLVGEIRNTGEFLKLSLSIHLRQALEMGYTDIVEKLEEKGNQINEKICSKDEKEQMFWRCVLAMLASDTVRVLLGEEKGGKLC